MEGGLSLTNARLIAQTSSLGRRHDDSAPFERYEELLDETFEQRQAAARARRRAAPRAARGRAERIALIRRIMLMKVKDRIKLG